MKHNIKNFIILLAAGALLAATPQGSSFLTEPTGQLVSAAVENHTSKKTVSSNKKSSVSPSPDVNLSNDSLSNDDLSDNDLPDNDLPDNIQSSVISDSTVTSVGTFKTQDINGNEYTQDIFSDYDLTMVNVFATWCSPCVDELPDLQKLSEEVAKNKDKKVQVVGIVLDAAGKNGEVDNNVLEKAQTLQSQVQITYPLLVPDSGNLNGRLKDIQAVPETFFVDKKGNIVGDTYSGSHSLDEWKEIIDTELSAMKNVK